MATIINATTIAKPQYGNTIRYRFRYEVSTGEVHERMAWVPSTVNEASERTSRGNQLLQELAEVEFLLNVGT